MRFGPAPSVCVCPVASDCGGCPLLGEPEEKQATRKLAQIRSALLVPCPTPGWTASPNPFGYRNRIRMRIDEQGELVFFNRSKTFACAVLEPAVRRALGNLRTALARSRGAFASFAHAEVRGPGLDGRPAVYLVPRNTSAALAGDTREAIASLENGGWWVEVAGAEAGVAPRYPLRDAWWEVPLGAFMQANSAVNELLVEHVVLGAARRGLQSFADLFSGAGNLALPLAASGLRGVAVEVSDRAARAAERCAQARSLTGLVIRAGDAHAWAAATARTDERFDLVVLDPPRAGLKGGAARFATLARSHILLCSCNTAALAVDLHALGEHGFEPESVMAFDMFPQTEHVEVAVWLGRSVPGVA